MLPVVTAEEMRDIDKRTIEELGLPGAVLMENAGRALVSCVEELQGARPIGIVSVLCGSGNNGGDGYVAARVLRERGIAVRLYAASPVANLKGDARLHAQAFVACGGELRTLHGSVELEREREALSESDIVVDALFGTGLDREIAGHWREIIECLNASPCQVIAADMPSGLRADNGQTLGVAVQANATVTFASAKVAHAGAPGFSSCGQLIIAEMGIPKQLAVEVAEIGLLEIEDVCHALAPESPQSHKGSRGHVLAIAGSPGKYGAGRLAGLAALRAGCGLATLAAEFADAAAEDPLMTAKLRAAEELEQLLTGKAAVLIGPGMDTGPQGLSLTRALLLECAVPIVMDADALNHLGDDLEPVASAKGRVVLTPHPGEAGRLLGISTAAVQADRIAAVRSLAKASGAVVVLKGARTCICDGREAPRFVAINPSGGPELSTAGTGDVLAGMLTALLARGLAPNLAARVAVYWHGEAGRVAKETLGGPGVVASDLLAAIPNARQIVESYVSTYPRPK